MKPKKRPPPKKKRRVRSATKDAAAPPVPPDGNPARVTAPALDEILGVRLPVLDDGFVRVVDYMGSDASIVQAARISYGAGTKKTREDRGLIRYLLRHRHTTPFEMCEIKIHVRVPMDCWRQWIRHRTANVNEYSTRYSVAIDAAQVTPTGSWRLQSTENRQGSDGAGFASRKIGEHLSARERELHALAREVYEERLQHGVAREQARKDLPLATYTEAYWKIDLHNLLHFLALRMAADAQLEIRQYATTIADVVARWCPIAWEAFLDYRAKAITLTGPEALIVGALARGNAAAAVKIVAELGLVERDAAGALKRNRERDELGQCSRAC